MGVELSWPGSRCTGIIVRRDEIGNIPAPEGIPVIVK